MGNIIPQCKKCNDTGTKSVPLFSSVEYVPCECRYSAKKKSSRIRLPTGCEIDVDDITWWSNDLFVCASCSVYHTRKQFMQAITI